MCGIAGTLDRDGAQADAAAVARMTVALAHRGPDGEGVHTDGAVALGNRRLAIIDLSAAGSQPMRTEDGAFAVTYNGELYNFRELRRELEHLGHAFRSRSDTEVVLRAYAEWGAAAVERFNGMFAFAIWDRPQQRLFLARDRYGVKPLYYAELGSTFVFASEVKSLLAHPRFSARLSLPHLREYFTFQNLFSDGTLFEGVKVLPAGCSLTVENGHLGVDRYWDFHFAEPDETASDAEYEEELDRLFRRAVERQLVSDVPVGAYLSGGLDSGSITAVAAERLPYLATFTVGFDLTSVSGLELTLDERAKAERMSYLFKSEHYEAVLKAGDMERCLPQLVWHLEDLRVGQCYPNYYVSRLASKFAKVVLSGTGGDELFAGYPWRYYRAATGDTFDHYVGEYFRFWNRLLPMDAMSSFFRDDVWREVSDVDTRAIFRAAFPAGAAPERPEDYVRNALNFEAKTFLHGLFLVDDKLSMAHGLESRVPFLDNDLVEFAQRLPTRLKLPSLEEVRSRDEHEELRKLGPLASREGKFLLRRVLSRYVPEELTNQVKQGFSGPDASWFRGESVDYVRRVVESDESRMYEFLEPATVRALVGEHLSAAHNRRLLIWSLLCFEQWCRIFLDGGRPDAH